MAEVPSRVAARSAPVAQVAERRVCSVLFCDLVGFTPLAESRDPEEVRELLSVYFERTRTVIGRYGGVVEKFIGDAVMAVWGTPVATEGDAERAVRAALEVVAAVAELGAEVEVAGLAARAGVVTGEVAVTVGASGEGVAGDAVNTAARVQSVAEPGSVWADAATYRLAGAGIGFTDTGEHLLKGKAEPVRLWSATRVLSAMGGAQRVDGLEAPLLGRDAELRTIKELFHASAERHTPRMVVVSGPPGVGKSRLGWEFEKYIDGLAETMYWHRGRCLSYGEGVAFWALTEIVRQRFGIAEEDPSEVATTKLATGLATFLPDPSERTYVGSRLGRLLGVPVAGDAEGSVSREDLFAGWRLFFERLADVQPVVLLVEDAQYGDAGLFDFLDHLVDWARDASIFVLVFGRPELDELRPGFGMGRNRSALTLDPLDARAMDALIDALVPGMPAEACLAISRQAEGIPLFAVETVRSLVDRDIVMPREGVYQLVADLGALSVPDSLHGLLAARLDALDPNLRALVADAAVLGTTFPAESLVAVSGQLEDDVRAGLAELLRREVLSVSADKLSPKRGHYRFAQELLRQVAYETLSRRDRKIRHLRVAAHLRSVFPVDGDEVTEVISRHYLDALAAVPEAPDIPEIRAQAVDMLMRAGDRALRAGAPRPAATNYASAAEQMELTAGPGEERASQQAAGLWEKAARAALDVFDVEGVLANAQRAGELYASRGEARAAARVQAIAGQMLMEAGRHTEARDRVSMAMEVLGAHPDADTVTALSVLAALETFGGGPDANRLSEEALALGQALDVDAGQLADLFISRGLRTGAASRTSEAIAHFKYAAELAERAGDGGRQARALLNLSDILAQSEPMAAAEVGRTAVELARSVGNIRTLQLALATQAEALLCAGAWDHAEQVIRNAIEVEQLGEIDYLATTASMLAALRGDPDTASSYAALPSLRSSEDSQDQAVAVICEAFLADARSQPADALRHAQASLAYASSLGIGHVYLRWAWPLAARKAHELDASDTVTELIALLDAHPVGHLPILLRAERDLARALLAVARGDAEAGILLEAAVRALRQAASPYHLAHGLLDQAGYFATNGDQSGATPLVDEARTIAGLLRARPLLDRAELILPGTALCEDTTPQLTT